MNCNENVSIITMNQYKNILNLIVTMGRRTARTSIVTADVEFDPTTCGDPSGNIVHEPDTLELVDTVESSV